jgi:hypothetical protein
MAIMGGYFGLEVVHLSARRNFFLRSGPSRTSGMAKAASQRKILLCAKNYFYFGAVGTNERHTEGMHSFYG